MSKSAPKVLLESVDKTTYKSVQVIEASGNWAVFYDDRPFNLKSQHYLDRNVVPKYKKTCFSNPGQARNLCRKLNQQFNTDKFSVVLLKNGERV